MQNNIILLMKKYSMIKNKGWIKSIHKGYGGSGLTFEYLLEKPKDNFSIPDFYGIEIKVKRFHSHSKITLFSTVPDGKSFFEVKRIVDKYGYPDYFIKGANILKGNIYFTKKTFIGKYFQFQLFVDYKKQQITLHVYDRNSNLIDNDTFWSFELLQSCLQRKLTYMAIITALNRYSHNEEYFKYVSIKLLQLRDFNSFLKLIETGIISLNINAGVYRDKKRYGQLHNHGCSFRISEEMIEKLFFYIDPDFFLGYQL